MNERIKELALQSGFAVYPDGWVEAGIEALERFADLVRQDEREACANLCDDLADSQTNQSLLDPSDCAKAIRARSKHDTNK